ncbi:HAP3_2 [Sanghuangporus weigelae]
MSQSYASERHSSPTHGDTEHGPKSLDAKECVQECVSEFISFVTSEAAEKCGLEKRKTVGDEDVLYALASLGFDNYSETLKIYLAKLRQHPTTNAAHRAGDGGHADMDED